MKCPGQDSRYWKPGSIFDTPCPHCGADLEFFKDDTTRLCKKCGKRIINPQMDFGCASYCPHAVNAWVDCPPIDRPKRDLLKDRVAIEMKRYFTTDFKRIGHATRVARYARSWPKKKKETRR